MASPHLGQARPRPRPSVRGRPAATRASLQGRLAPLVGAATPKGGQRHSRGQHPAGAISSVGHAADDPGRVLGRSRLGGNHIKRRMHAGLPQAANRNHIKRQLRAAGITSSGHRVQ
ncbi:hypothetical protein B296_00019830 [Ensete ventricosum]|uniref:Uncharacterized protein n=1 Tax=Ensete ventricosum TaxID=4639 RepID=A0A426ZDP4_ENSVE|nr:hypothetical protein B296_00019830 [Ensete ventricosum]